MIYELLVYVHVFGFCDIFSVSHIMSAMFLKKFFQDRVNLKQ